MTSLSADPLVEAYAEIRATNQYLLAKLQSVLALFQEQQIGVILLKGADLLTRLYGAMGLRPMTDLDLLVHEEDLPRIDAVLRDAGYQPSIDGNPSYTDANNTVSLDIVADIWYLDDTDGIWHRAMQRTQGDAPVKGMGASDLLIFLTAYIVVYRGYLSTSFARDVALLVEKEAVDWAFVVEEAVRRRLKIPLSYGLAYAATIGRADIPGQILAQLAPSGPAERALLYLLQRLVTEQRVAGLSHFLLFLTQPGWRRWKWLARSLFPSQAFLRYRYGERAETHPILTRLLRPLYLLRQALGVFVRILTLLLRRGGSNRQACAYSPDGGDDLSPGDRLSRWPRS